MNYEKYECGITVKIATSLVDTSIFSNDWIGGRNPSYNLLCKCLTSLPTAELFLFMDAQAPKIWGHVLGV